MDKITNTNLLNIWSQEHLILAKMPRSDAFLAVCPTYFYGTLVPRKRGEKELACERL